MPGAKMELRKIYEYALSREYEGKRFFEENAERLKHAAAVQAFKQLALEEQKHIEFIQGHLMALEHGISGEMESKQSLETVEFFSVRALSEGLEQSITEAMVPDLPVLRMAYLIERDFAEFYEMAAGRVEGPARDILLMLSHWERGHERLFKQFHDKAFAIYMQMPWGG
jgi:rubrerythrin